MIDYLSMDSYNTALLYNFQVEFHDSNGGHHPLLIEERDLIDKC